MRVIIAGGRDIRGSKADRLVEEAIEASGFKPFTELINGGADGIDAAARRYWNHRFLLREPEYPLRTVYAEWSLYGKAAGPMRNRKMAGMADALIAIWDGKSRGTKSMIDAANFRQLKVYIHMVEEVVK